MKISRGKKARAQRVVIYGPEGVGKSSLAEEQPFFKDVGSEIISANELISQQQEILVRNGENQRKRNNVAQLEQSYKNGCSSAKCFFCSAICPIVRRLL